MKCLNENYFLKIKKEFSVFCRKLLHAYTFICNGSFYRVPFAVHESECTIIILV